MIWFIRPLLSLKPSINKNDHQLVSMQLFCQVATQRNFYFLHKNGIWGRVQFSKCQRSMFSPFRTHNYGSTTVKKRGAAVEEETKLFEQSFSPRFEVLVSIGPIGFHFFTSYWSDFFLSSFLSVITNQLDTILKSEQKKIPSNLIIATPQWNSL